jgi:hypothetical protein
MVEAEGCQAVLKSARSDGTYAGHYQSNFDYARAKVELGKNCFLNPDCPNPVDNL